jgi:hypothetical protein
MLPEKKAQCQQTSSSYRYVHTSFIFEMAGVYDAFHPGFFLRSPTVAHYYDTTYMKTTASPAVQRLKDGSLRLSKRETRTGTFLSWLIIF